MGENTGRAGPTELHGIKVLDEKASGTKGKFTCLPILSGLPMGKVNTSQPSVAGHSPPGHAIGKTETGKCIQKI